ncbi:MAG TPA: glycoside hydrolase family 15 protein [Thermomicrobiales bacterium]|nr:glycoside hydrolase family 15 protein [Thermomicrobiales bacterium]
MTLRDRPIADYALIGDCRTAALVSTEGAVDWCCLPRFDSPSVFAALLDPERGGTFRIAPAGTFRSRRRYLPETAVLETTFETAAGVATVTDFLPLPGGETDWPDFADLPDPRLVRVVRGLRGAVDLEIACAPRPDYARRLPALAPCAGGVAARAGDEVFALQADVPLDVAAGEARARVTVRAGEQHYFVLSRGDGGEAPDWPRVRRWLAQTVGGWALWSQRCAYTGPYHDMVLRSALTLKLLTYSPTGAIVAAPTTSLPEALGGERNWDYRYTWLRDATFTLAALADLGYRREAVAFRDWLLRACADPAAPLQIMYTIDGGAHLPEATLDHLAGYRGSRPVRVGNGAAHQRQLDVYGELLDAADRYRALGGAVTPEVWALMRRVADRVCAEWREPDAGIWEVRGGPQHFTYSKVMCWVALDRAIRAAETLGHPADLPRWRAERDAIRQAVLARGYNPRVGAFTQALGSDVLDASALLLPLVGFIAVDDPRMRRTIETIDAGLTRGGLVYRYRDAARGARLLGIDGLDGDEGTFAICTFWLLDCLIAQGRVAEARARFERLLGCANDLGLYAEELDPVTGELLGNFPQAFTHIALITTAVRLAAAEARQPGARAA